MTLGLPFDLWTQALVAFVSGVTACLLGLRLISRTWAYGGERSVREFLIGLCLASVGFLWLVNGVAIITAAVIPDSGSVVRDGVVFSSALVRSIVIICGGYLLYRSWRSRSW